MRPEIYAEIARSLSPERLKSYCDGCTSEVETLARYAWNVRLCSALYPSLQTLEVALRNNIDLAVRNHYHDEKWLRRDSRLLLHRDREAVAEACRKLRSSERNDDYKAVEKIVIPTSSRAPVMRRVWRAADGTKLRTARVVAVENARTLLQAVRAAENADADFGEENDTLQKPKNENAQNLQSENLTRAEKRERQKKRDKKPPAHTRNRREYSRRKHEERTLDKSQDATLITLDEPAHGEVVAELPFGFWVGLLESGYEPKLWPLLLPQVFPAMPEASRQRRAIALRFDALRRLRNRIFHHKPIWKNAELQSLHGEIIETIGWMNPALGQMTQIVDGFPKVYSDEYFESLKQAFETQL